MFIKNINILYIVNCNKYPIYYCIEIKIKFVALFTIIAYNKGVICFILANVVNRRKGENE